MHNLVIICINKKSVCVVDILGARRYDGWSSSGRKRRVASTWPVLEVHAWLPPGAIRKYQTLIPRLEKIPFIRRFGVSVFVAARKPR